MQKGLFVTVLPAFAILLSGCSTPPPQQPLPESAETRSAMHAEMQARTDEITQAGGLAVLGIARSKSPELAQKMAKRNGRLELARVLNSEIVMLTRAFSAEKNIPYDSPGMAGFNDAARMIIRQTIASSEANGLKYEMDGETTVAYTVMVLDPKILADQLAKDPNLGPALQSGKWLDPLKRKIEAYEAFTAAPKTSL